MEMEMNEDLGITLGETVDRIAAAAASLEQSVERLEEKIAAAEQKLIALEARAAVTEGCPTSRRDAGSRKTLPTAMTTLLAKQGVTIDGQSPVSLEAGSLDAALSSLSLEQRIAVKSQLIRAGLLS